MTRLISKSAFAELTNVSCGRVSQWLAEKKISGDAIVGVGRRSRINVDVAITQLRKNLDISQHLGANGKARLVCPPVIETDRVDCAAGALATNFVDPIEDRIKLGRLEGIERENRRKAREEEASRGRYVRADDVKKQFSRTVSQLTDMLEGWLVEVAPMVSAASSMPQRDVLQLLQNEFLSFRSSSIAVLRQASVISEPNRGETELRNGELV